MSHRFTTSMLLIVSVLLVATFLGSCNRADTNNGASNGATPAQSSPAAPPKTGFEADLEFVRKGQYNYVWVFSRKDGQPLDGNDKAYLKKNAPQVVDWVTSGEARKVIAGTNFDLAKGNLALLQKRFNVEDYTGK